MSKISRGNGDYIEYYYTSTGTKRQTKRYIGGVESYTFFDGEMIYTHTGPISSLNDYTISEIQNEEGRFVRGKLEYGYTDHLGNLRLSYRDSLGTAAIVQINSYDAWGMEIRPLRYILTGSKEDKYTWNGKEDLSEDGLEDWSDFGWRIEDRTLGRWFTPDPDDQFDGMSPFAYCANNPVSHIDPDGRFLPLLMVALFSGHISGMIAEANGGSYGKAFAIGAATSLIGGAIGAGVGNLVGIGNTLMGSVARGALGGLLSGAVSGGIGSAMSGGNFWDGALNGGISGAIAGGLMAGGSFLNTKAQFNATKARFAGVNEIQAKGVKPLSVKKMDMPEIRPVAGIPPRIVPTATNTTYNIYVDRIRETTNSTISSFTIDGENSTGFILEPRGTSTTTSGLDRRIPTGEYELNWHDSQHLNGTFPELSNTSVSSNRHILIHSGNTPDQTLGCLLPGTGCGVDQVTGSRAAFQTINNFIRRRGIENVRVIIRGNN